MELALFILGIIALPALGFYAGWVMASGDTTPWRKRTHVPAQEPGRYV